MNKDEIAAKIIEMICTMTPDRLEPVTAQTELIGSGSVLDSMKLVELCLALEDAADDLGFNFDWTSAAAMSRSRSMFRTVDSLVTEFISQMDGNQ